MNFVQKCQYGKNMISIEGYQEYSLLLTKLAYFNKFQLKSNIAYFSWVQNFRIAMVDTLNSTFVLLM